VSRIEGKPEGATDMVGKIAARNIRLKRAYEEAAKADGRRILVDRLWPRGVSKAAAAIDGWMKDIAPSNDLRRWFGHNPARWQEFRRRYAAELRDHRDRLRELRRFADAGVLTLVYSARDTVHNDAVVLRQALLGRWPARGLTEEGNEHA
jgi:uncharacterized protein YeaO (DUF488 family)